MGTKTSQLVKEITGNHLGVLQRPLLLVSYRKASLTSHSHLGIAAVVVLKKLCVRVCVRCTHMSRLEEDVRYLPLLLFYFGD